MDRGAVSKELANLPKLDQAAALVHLLYCEVSAEFGWENPLPADWSQLDERTKAFNRATVKKWAESPTVFDQWVQLVRDVRPPA